jgi:hypothetical protein
MLVRPFGSAPSLGVLGTSLAMALPGGRWRAKVALVTFNPGGRRAVSSLAGDRAWRKVALARLPVALVLAVLGARA